MSKSKQTKGRSRHRSVRRFSADDSRRRTGELAHELLHGAFLLERMFAAVVADSRPLRDAHPELRVAIVKMEDALRDLYEAADAVLIKELETHPRPEVARKLDNYGAPVGQRAPGRSIRHIASRANSEAR